MRGKAIGMRGPLLLAVLLALPSPRASAQLPARWVRSPLTEVARAQVHAEVGWERYGLRGRGAALCLVDTGVDPRHGDFRSGDERRLRWVLDSFGAPRGRFPSLEARFGGAVFRGDEPEVPGDPHGHGTAMASIALGDGTEGGGTGAHAGLAPAAALIAVRAYDPTRGGFPDGAVVEGVRFCRAVAEADDALDPARMVVLLSLGGHDGAHDGRGAFEQALEALGREVPIVVAAGNDGERAVRATGRLFAGERSGVGVQVPRSNRADAELALTVRADAPFALVAPDGTRRAGWSGPGEAALSGARVRVEEVEGEAGVLRVVLGAEGGALEAGTYRIELEGPARFEVWLAGHRLGATFFGPELLGPHVRRDEAITIPATAEGLIAVGATVARPQVGALADQGPAGDTAAFSSRGPAPSGAPKPDLVAPGGWILAALSGDVRDGDPDNLVGGSLTRFLRDGRIAVRGTSAAAAVVAGALLLALEREPRSGPDARALLTASAVGERAWSPDRGAGRLDVGRLLEAWSGAPRRLERGSWVATRALASGDEALWLVARGLGGGGAAGEVLTLTLDGRELALPLAHGAGRFALPPPPALLGEPLLVRGAIDGEALAPLTIPVVLERSEHGAVGVGGGGCAVSAKAGASGAAILLVLLVVPLRARRGAQPPLRARRGRG